MSEWGIINGNPIIFQMGSSPKWDIGHVTVTRHGEHITSFTLHDFVLTLVPTYHFETPRSHHSLLKIQDAPENGYDWERDNVNKKWGREEIGGWAEILVMILVGVGEKWWDYCIFLLVSPNCLRPGDLGGVQCLKVACPSHIRPRRSKIWTSLHSPVFNSSAQGWEGKKLIS